MIFKQKKPILLASGSPRRKQYLQRYGLRFRVVTAQLDEKVLPNEDPLLFVTRMAGEKNLACRNQAKAEEIIISADTIVLLDGIIIGKPKTTKQILPMLKSLNGKEHQVITSYVIFDPETNNLLQNQSISQVKFFSLPDRLLQAYGKTEEPRDKAGSYSIQGVGSFMVESITGSYNNVVGLPMELLLRDLLKNGFLELTD